MEAKERITSSAFQPDASLGEAAADKNTSRIRSDFEGLLELAEKLQQSYEERGSSYQKLFMTLQGFTVLLLLELFAGFFIWIFFLMPPFVSLPGQPYSPVKGIASIVADIAFGAITFFYFITLRQQYQQLKRRMYADERDISEVVKLLREIEPVFAEAEKLSALERVQIRIRLSRFGIGSSPRNDLEQASPEMKGDFRARKSRVDQELMKPL